MSALYGAVEAGGTKFVCAVGTGPEDLRDELRFPTTTPQETLGKVIEYFTQAQKKHGPLKVIGIGCFGPISLDQKSPQWGWVTSTPKPYWTNTDVAPFLQKSLKISIAWDTDVNAAALGESLWGAGKGLSNIIYLTVGTGIGGGVLINGQPLHGLVHPELGHMLIQRNPEDAYEGKCPYHKGCLEGMAAGPAIEARWKEKAFNLNKDHPAWDLEATYLAQALQNYLLCFSPQRIILGGGVMEQSQLFPLIRKKLMQVNAGYVVHPAITPEGIDNFIVPPGLGNKAGILGSMALAMNLEAKGSL